MGMSQLALDLPTSRPEPEAVATAAAELYERGIDDFTHLELRTTHATGTALIRRFTFTYWTPTTKALPHTISYVELWARLGHPHQTALLTLGHTAAITEPVREGLIHAAGEDFLLRDIWGNHHLPGKLPGLPQHHRPRAPIARHPTYIPYIVTPQLVTTLVGADFHSRCDHRRPSRRRQPATRPDHHPAAQISGEFLGSNEPPQAGSFRRYLDGERWQWSDPVARMHGHQP
jgi:hypothetical protein